MQIKHAREGQIVVAHDRKSLRELVARPVFTVFSYGVLESTMKTPLFAIQTAKRPVCGLARHGRWWCLSSDVMLSML